jgi:Na+-transporting NADH:ubiquinone oxidoreductase subunit C
VPDTHSTRYTVGFAAAVCVACALLVAASAVGLRERQETNQLLYRQRNVLQAADLIKPDDNPSDQEVLATFDRRIRVRLVELKTGELVPENEVDARSYDQRKARSDPTASHAAPPNAAQISRVPNYGAVYFVVDAATGRRIEQIVIPVEGVGMWGTLYGFLAIARDTTTITGLTYYDQKETPGLGGESGNPRWQALWRGRKAYDEKWEPSIVVIKGQAGPPSEDPHRVDGLSGATITSNGITRMMRFWLGNDGYGPFLKKFREGALKFREGALS